jgi:hypothetical protein
MFICQVEEREREEKERREKSEKWVVGDREDLGMLLNYN